ncbi:MAG TPA: heparan-alpha-glucosaminide N-acetyltransferase domain-containing protein [Candidatus Angelobacter sp.]|nr:heparan-alpha-glucosaminide N-acetyltransferase domain-containing protein [Candidatus Angelobacter sp.]
MAISTPTTLTSPQTEPVSDAIIPASRQRLESLDVFRGLTIAGMILVNDPGSNAIYWPLGHADELASEHTGWYAGKWWIDANGWTPTDLIFPFFLFIVGVSMVMSFAARRSRGDSRSALFKHAVQRSAWILFIGYAIRILPLFHFAHFRYAGVLQRIAVVYLCASAITLWTATRGRVLWIAGLLVGYFALMRFVPVPGCDPGGWMTQHCSLAGWLDRKLMLGHLYRTDFDPEGVLSTLPAIATTLLGTLIGEFLRSAANLSDKLRTLVIAGIAGVLAGYLWHPWFPISKPLWTSSYVLFTAGASCLTLALCWWLIEMRSWRTWSRPFLWLGSNAILAYALSTFAAKLGYTIKVGGGPHPIGIQSWIFEHWFAPLASPKNASLAFSLSYVAVWMLVCWGLYRKKIFVKV